MPDQNYKMKDMIIFRLADMGGGNVIVAMFIRQLTTIRDGEVDKLLQFNVNEWLS